jgi:cobalt-zinc-cadmium efflux system membrane fusion protein
MRFVLCAMGLLAGCSGSPGGEATAGANQAAKDFIKIEPGSPHLDFIKVEQVQESDAATAVSLTGKVTFDEDHTQRVASPIDGRVTALLAKPGDKVKSGQALLELSSPNVGQLQADAQKALQDLSLQTKAVERVHKLQADGAISDKEVAQAESDFKKAKSDVARTSAQLKSLGVSASDPAVSVALRAQVSGVLVERNVLVGQEVRADAAAPLLTITSLDSVWVLADAYEQDLSLVQEGAGVSLHVPAYPGETFPGVVSHIGDVVDKDTRTVKIRCSAPNKDHRLKPEMFAKVDLQNKTGKKVVVIPSRAVINEGELTKVIVATEGNMFRGRKIDVGPEVDGRIRVLSGLQPGEKIVTDGAFFLKKEIDTN